MFVHTDYHTHTLYSHGTGSVQDNVVGALRNGLRGVGISDHGPANLFGVGVRSLDSFAQIRAEVAHAAHEWPGIKVFFGVEANVVSTEGHLDIPLEMQGEFDYVMAGLHPLVLPKSIAQSAALTCANLIGKWDERWRLRARMMFTDALVEAVYRNRIHVITHPGYRLSIDTRELAKACAATQTALEINAGHEHMTVEYIRIAAEEGVSFVIGSDAHQPERVGDFSRAIEIAKQAGLTAKEILNAVPAPRTE